MDSKWLQYHVKVVKFKSNTILPNELVKWCLFSPIYNKLTLFLTNVRSLIYPSRRGH